MNNLEMIPQPKGYFKIELLDKDGNVKDAW